MRKINVISRTSEYFVVSQVLLKSVLYSAFPIFKEIASSRKHQRGRFGRRERPVALLLHAGSSSRKSQLIFDKVF